MMTCAITGTLGSLGIGSVWGWLVARFSHRLRKPIITFLSVLLATMVIASQVMWLLDRTRLLFFFGSVIVSFLVHMGWRGEMTRRKRLLTIESGGAK